MFYEKRTWTRDEWRAWEVPEKRTDDFKFSLIIPFSDMLLLLYSVLIDATEGLLKRKL